jgi:hypothetical protein
MVIGPTYKNVIMTLARAWRVAEAERVLADYYDSWSKQEVHRMVGFDHILDK